MPTDVQRIQAVFLSAVEISDSADRARFLDGACAGDAGLRSRVEALLCAHDQPNSLLDHPGVAPNEPDRGTTRTIGHEGAAGTTDEVPLGFLAPPTRPDSLGRIGHYEVLQVLGQGGFGIVFRAFDDVLHRVVAVKVLSPQVAATSPARKRFLREAQSSAQVRHENVVQVYEVGEQPLPYLVMEFIPGETLQQKLDRSGPLDVPEVLRIGRQIAEGLAAAHACDLIHRDIKPGNILLEGGSHKAKITDFGLARAADDASISQSGVIVGTPMFMAPEQALGQHIDQRADLFSLGSVLYQLTSGRPPFRAPTALAVLKRVAEEPPRPIPEIIPETPDWLCAIIAKLHAKNPDDRFQSAREVADLLADCEGQLKTHSKVKDYSRIPHGKPAAASRRRIGRKWKWAAAVALVLLLGGVWFGRAAMLYLSDRGELEIVPQDGLVSVIVLQNDEGVIDPNKLRASVTDWLDMKKSHTLKLPPGRYQLNVGTWPAGIHVSQWEVTTSGPFGSNRVTVSVINTSAIVIVERGHRVTLRAVMRDSSSPPPSPKGEEGWVQLFNGKDLTGWKTHPDQPGDWRVEDGVLVGRGPQTSYLFSDRGDYGDFHLRVEAKLEPGGNSGVCFRSGFKLISVGADPELRLPPGFEADINDAPKQAAKTGTLWRIGPGVGTMVLVKEALITPNTGFQLEVIAVGPRITVKVNGRTTADWWDDRTNHRTGHVALQVNWPVTTIVRFRKIEIKELPPGSPAMMTPPPPVAPFTDADTQRIAALPTERQVEEVRKELMRRNPGFDGKMETKIEGGGVAEFRIVTDKVTDIAPIRVFGALRVLECSGTYTDKPNGLLADLTPLVGMSLAGLRDLNLVNTKVNAAGMVCFKDSKNLTALTFGNTPVSDAGLANFKECKALTYLALGSTPVSDAGLANFKDMRLRELYIDNTGITDLTPLQGMPLEKILLTPKNITRGLDILRDMKSLKTIGIGWNRAWPAAEFWDRYDRGEFKE